VTPGDTLPCSICGAAGAVTLDQGVEATVGTVAVLLERLPVVVCPQGHRRPPEAAIGAAMTAVDATVPRARGRLLRSEVCSTCGTPITMPARRTTRTISVADTPGLPVLTLRFDLPLARCTECGLDQLPTRSQEDLVVSVPAVFERGQASGAPAGT
jgi:hypothetical protein